MFKKVLTFILTMFITVGILPTQQVYATEKEVSIWSFNSETEMMEEADEVKLYQGGEVYLSAFLRDDIAGELQWQIEVSKNLWVDIHSATSEDLRVSEGLLSGLQDSDSARIRCNVSTENGEFSSDAVKVKVVEEDAQPVFASFAMERNVSEEQIMQIDDSDLEAIAEGDLPSETDKIYTITIEYVYGEGSKYAGQRVAIPYIAEVAEGVVLEEIVASPSVVGYTADVLSINLKEYGEIKSNLSFEVSYSPALVSYTVRHYKQNLENDEYVLVDTTLASGYTEDSTENYPSAINSYEGFSALSHYPEIIAADSSTHIDVYYDRNYYLISFDLNGGYGVEPIYARYGEAVSVNEPTKQGWKFDGWTDITDGAKIKPAVIPATVPARNMTFSADWETNPDAGTTFTVVYWLEDPNNPGKYIYWAGIKDPIAANAGDTVNGEDYKDYSKWALIGTMGEYEKKYSSYNAVETDKNVVVKGDNSTVVNVYYDRNEYTLKFYYAAYTANNGYKIFGGSTYAFGASHTDSSNYNYEMELLDYMYNEVSNQWGSILEAPSFNGVGTERIKSNKYTIGVDSYNNVDYLYLSFSAKYGADISGLWPCNIFNAAERTDKQYSNGWSGTAAYVSAWNGEHHVHYSQTHGNQTIKGNYNELDYQLLFHEDYSDSSTVAYLCFWENGSNNVDWNKPRLFRYNIYVPVMPGQDTTGLVLSTRDEDGKDYYLLYQYDTCDDSDLAGQTEPAISGYTYIKDSKKSVTITDFDKNNYVTAEDILFYYSRDGQQLLFMNGNSVLSSSYVNYGMDISNMAPTGFEYPDKELKDNYEFVGWTTSPDALEGTEFSFENATMPDHTLTLYANWQLKQYDIDMYPDQESAEDSEGLIGTVVGSHDQYVLEEFHPEDPVKDNATFIGWFYKDENGVEKAFSFEATKITSDMVIYAKWRSNEVREVTLRYVIIEDGKEVEIADTDVLMLRVGVTRTFEAKLGNDLYEGYQSRCFPETSTHSITPTSNDGEIEFIFYYKKYDSVAYKVQFFVERDTNGDGIADVIRHAFKSVDGKAVFVTEDEYNNNQTYTHYEEVYTNNDKSIVTELYLPDNLSDSSWTLPTEYIPNALKIQHVIVPTEGNAYNEQNTIKFIYRFDESSQIRLYSVNHYVQNAEDSSKYDLYSFDEYSEIIGNKVSASPISIPGYEFSSAVTKENLNDNSISADNVITGEVKADNSLELNFYYTFITYPYQVLYLEQDTNRVLKEAKTRDADNVQLRAPYGAKVTEEYEEIQDYEVDAKQKAIFIQQEAGDVANINTIVFYYTRKSADLIVSKQVTFDPEQGKENGIDSLPDSALTQEFDFTLTSMEGFHKSVYDYTVYDNNLVVKKGNIAAGTTSLSFKLKSGQSIEIHGLALGEYKVTETYIPGFNTVVKYDNEEKNQQSQAINLDVSGETERVDFINRYPFYTGNLVLKKEIIKLDDSDPEADGNLYRVHVQLKPDDEARFIDREITWINGDNTNGSLIIPALKNDITYQRKFDIYVDILVDDDDNNINEVVLTGVPVGEFTAIEEAKSIGYVTDYYQVTYNKATHQNDEVTGNLNSVNGVIHGGHPTAITFKNTYKKGKLVIDKTVTQEYENDNWSEDTFEFKITGVTELPDGTYQVSGANVVVSDGKVTVLTADNKNPSITISKTDSGNSWTGSIEFDNLPAGYYTVEEILTDEQKLKYNVTPESMKIENLLVSRSSSTDTAFTAASFSNQYIRTKGNLKVEKEVVTVTADAVIDAEQPFTFSISIKDGELNGSYECVVMNTKGTLDVQDDEIVPDSITQIAAVDGKLTFTLKHQQYIVIKDLPVGNYAVREEHVDGYQSSFTEQVVDSKDTVDPAEIRTGKTTNLKCLNAYPVYYANLTVEKVVVTPDDYSDLDKAPADDVFTYQVVISDYGDKVNVNSVAATFYRIDASSLVPTTLTPVSTTLTPVTVDEQSKKLIFTLKHGEKVILNLPACMFTIEEIKLNDSEDLDKHYDVSFEVNSTQGVQGAEYGLASGHDVSVVFTNTYKRHLSSLTIDTISKDSSQVYVFTITSTETNYPFSMQVTVKGNDSVTIADLPYGKYKVTESNEWSWREAAVSEQNIDLQSQSQKLTFNFGDSDHIYWINYNSDVVQNMKTRGKD